LVHIMLSFVSRMIGLQNTTGVDWGGGGRAGAYVDICMNPPPAQILGLFCSYIILMTKT
jgi:hypothetical protein